LFVTFLSRLADRLILQPTTNYVDPQYRQQKVIETPTGQVEVWVSELTTQPASTSTSESLLLLKFPGTGGRAERSGVHPADAWPEYSSRAWTVNHRGYGGSSAPASIQNFAETCDAVWGAATELYPDHKVVVFGNSLGCISALYIASRFNVVGAFIRNPPPLAVMIASRPRYAAWSLGMSKLIANQIPKELDSIENAKRSSCPALFIQSELDRVVPPKYQDLVFDQYGGEKRKLVLLGADHHHRADEAQRAEYWGCLKWLSTQFAANTSTEKT